MKAHKIHFDAKGQHPLCRARRLGAGNRTTLTMEWEAVTCARCLHRGWEYKLHNKWLPEYQNHCGKPTARKAVILANFERLRAKQR